MNSMVQQGVYEYLSNCRNLMSNYDIESLEYAVKELILTLYKTDINMFLILKDMMEFSEPYGERVQGTIISAVYNVMLTNWLETQEPELTEKCSDILLRIAIRYLEEKPKITMDCFISLDNIAGDLFEESVLSRIIILGAIIEESTDLDNKRLNKLKNDLLNAIKWNDIYSHDAVRYDYLISSIEYAKGIQSDYEIDIEKYRKKYLVPILKEIVEQEIEEYIQYFDDLIADSIEGKEEISESSIEYAAQDLEGFIRAFSGYDKDILSKISDKITGKRDFEILYKKIIDRMHDKEKKK